jgi:hypothetical protein
MVQAPSIRDQMREATFARDGGRCVLCGAPAVDAHHIIERRLWSDGGYHLDNLASVCEDCHMACEQTIYTVEAVREAAGIERVVLPEHMYSDVRYDKWGNVINADGTRSPGELFYDESVQKVLRQGGVLVDFVPWVKYPRTYHLPWSPGVTSDDRVMEDLSGFEGQEVVVTEKMDGENTSLYPNGYVHARSVDGASHPSQSWIRSTWAKVAYELPAGWRVCGENLYAVHSIRYDSLPSYFAVFSVWNERNECLSWDDTCDWAELLGFLSVPVLYRGQWDEKAVRGVWSEGDRERVEGYVVRPTEGFHLREFRQRVGKFVRENHVTSDRHWKAGRALEKNGLI